MRPKTNSDFEWPTLLLLCVTYVVWAIGTLVWTSFPPLSIALIAIATAQFSSLQHEVLHGHPFQNKRLNEALVFPALGLVMPYQRFRDLHLQHHFDPDLTDPYDDPESNYYDPAVWVGLSGPMQQLLRFNNTLLGRMLVGPAVGLWAFVSGDVARVRLGNRAVLRAWAMNAAGLVPVAVWLALWGNMPLWAYGLGAYFGFSLLKIRTFLEHRAHDIYRARTVVIEDHGPLALLFLNNNFHAVHHMHPRVAWYRLPALYAAKRDHYLRCNQTYVYKSYAEVFRRYFLHAKDPVPHPVWPQPKSGEV